MRALRPWHCFLMNYKLIILAVLASLTGLPALATIYTLPANSPPVFGVVEQYQAVFEDTLPDLARRYSLGYEEINRANPALDPWLPGAGAMVTIPGRRILPPGPREGIVVNLAEHRLYYYPKVKKGQQPTVITYPVSVGKMDWHTPLGETRIVDKRAHPTWTPPESVRKEHAARGEPLPRVVPAGPDNPLGQYAMRLGIKPGAYLIHGTNNPLAVGMAVTHGCIRMYPEDIAALFPMVPVGTKVWLINEPVKVAYVEGELLLEAHPGVDGEGQTIAPNVDLLSQRLDAVLGETTAAIHWDLALQTLQVANGIPTVVGIEADLDPAPGIGPEGLPPGTPAPGTPPEGPVEPGVSKPITYPTAGTTL